MKPLPPAKISLLFWNINKKDIPRSIASLVQEYRINILMLAEINPDFGTKGILAALNEAPDLTDMPPFEEKTPAIQPKANTAMSRFSVFANLPNTSWELRIMQNRYAIWEVSVAQRRKFLLATVHFPAIEQDQGDKQRETAIALRRDLEEVETAIVSEDRQRREPLSIIMGDFNANPFDPGIVSVYGLNATHLRHIAEREFRSANGLRHKYLYNPLWRFLGREPWGTYYNDELSAPARFDWFLMDQVLVRPAVMLYFDKGDKPDVLIPTSDGVKSLLNSDSVPNKDFSDHLPLLFRFDLPYEPEESETA